MGRTDASSDEKKVIGNKSLSYEAVSRIKGNTDLSADGIQAQMLTRVPARSARNIGKCISLAILYILASSGMILFNKYLMDHNRFPYPIALTTLHMASAFALGSVLYRFAPSAFPSAPAIFDASDSENQLKGTWSKFVPFAPIGLFGAIAISFGNTAYKYASVSFLQMIKEANIVCIYTVMVMFGLDTFKISHAFILLFVAASATYATCGANSFTWFGMVLQVVAGLATSLQVVLTNRLMIQRQGSKIDAMTMVLCTSPFMLLSLLPANIAYWDPQIPRRMIIHSTALVANVALALTLQVISIVTIKEISATGHALASIMKDIAIICGATYGLHEALSTSQVFGFTLTIVGIFAYSGLKLFPQLLGETK